MTDNMRKVEALQALRADLARDQVAYWALTMAIDAYIGASPQLVGITRRALDDALDAGAS